MKEALISAFKRNSRKDILAEVLEMTGHSEQAEEVRAATKITAALINRTCIEQAPPVYTEEDQEIDEEIQEELESDSTYFDIGDAIEAGNGKKALKLIKQAKENGHSGQVLKDLKKQAKELV